ncbi:hypothetical protein R0131_03810 [Clostridium sp. AL.422]|uniref:hypothetical protein n=1 Tax=Clostridium TaxID=1485 RepID=UPI00293DB10E|nr:MULTISPECIES: hypothetical protein [unclassified Clostridium]MDV4149954.1 hypothetical protein [Clostridium sp. AL.422]
MGYKKIRVFIISVVAILFLLLVPQPPQPSQPSQPPQPAQPSPPPIPTYGMSPSEIESRLVDLGMTYDTESSGYGINVYVSSTKETVIAISNNVKIELYKNNATDDSIVKQVLNMALPTAGNEIYNMVSDTFGNQTIERDGRQVELWNADAPIVTIYY